MKRLAFAVCVAVCVAACASAPPVPVVPGWDLAGDTTPAVEEDERALWREASEFLAKTEEKGFLVSNESQEAYLRAVAERLLEKPLPTSGPKITVRVVRSPERNALALADGTILLTTGMVAALENEAQLAALLAHELCHVVKRHNLVGRRFEQVSRSTVERMELSRELERDCDRFAFVATRRAGYDVAEIPRMQEKLIPEEARWSGGWPEFRTHPYLRERIRETRRWIAKEWNSNAASEPGQRDEQRYLDAVVETLAVAAETDCKAGLLDRAAETISRYLRARPESGRGHFIQAEILRRKDPQGLRSARVFEAYLRAVQLAPDDAEVVRAAALACEANGDWGQAHAWYRRYLELAPQAADRKLVERYLQRTSGERERQRASDAPGSTAADPAAGDTTIR